MKVSIHWTYQTKKKYTTFLHTEYLPVKEALLLAEDFESTGRTKDLLFVEENNSTWTKKQIIKYLKELEEEPHDFKIYFDGGFDVQTFVSGIGVCIYYHQNGKEFRKRYNNRLNELSNNNEAEYAALENAINILEEMAIKGQEVTIYGDSQVVINQLNGEWPCYEEQLEKYANRIAAALNSLKLSVQYVLLNRNENKEADMLATQALKGTFIESTKEIS